ncbi:hypothetical protein BGZ75_005146 [Mortierella antarctica]|nr:hypothetical protein BGZ75_005146 [Mortierella antarctica]
MHSDTTAWTAAQSSASLLLLSSTSHSINGNSPQTIAQISSRYIWLLWLPLLPLLILAAAGQTSANFESPVKYLV